MGGCSFLLQLLIILISTKLAGDLSVRVGQPAVLGKLISGIIIGPAVLNLVQEAEFIKVFSEIGVLLLMFIAGLETNLTELNRNLKSSITVAIGGVIMPYFGGLFVGQHIFGMSVENSMFLGLLFSATSVSISVQILKELGQLNSRESATILGAAIADDIIVVVLLAVMIGFLTNTDSAVGMVIGKNVLFFTAIAFLGWKVLPWFLNIFSKLKVSEPIITAALIGCFIFAYFAEYLGVAGIIGSFAAGLSIAQTKFKDIVGEKIEPIAYSIFVPVFFVSIGLVVSFDGVAEHLDFIVLLSVISILAKLIGCGFGARITGFNFKSSLQIGAAMISRGEVALILAVLGRESGLLEENLFTSVIIVVMVTTLVTPPALKILFDKKQEA